MTIVQNQNQNQSKSHVENTLYTAPPLRCRQHLFSPAVSVVVPAIHHTLFSLRRFQLGTKAAGSFNHHGMQYSTTVPNDLDIHKDFRPSNKLESSGLSLKDIVEQDVKDNPVMLYMKGVPDLPRCGFSSLSLTLLFTDLTALGYYGILTIDMPFADVPLSARNILEDPELKNAVKAYSEAENSFQEA
ncbi:hypothetical protein LOK49_LG08G02288 [Camellia lanceoleosa]|uniref:Uncharacterized protein n=1 Tax=Camellia lanceoleosa TaxID=1840588 RepID=A0ACC0GQ57_9ERIC|nr:hypothetical protein LOK49_LG08G02288 [Camellia lanceoleosa]